ncbi:MAG TPA: AAA family ATPase [Candidatus Acidoferrum sp.]|nr:AAA family ATPase [Candidatus Acidoferrum sp.]
MATVERSARIGVMAVCLDATSFEALSHFMAGVPGAVIYGNPDHYVGVEREVGRALDLAQTRICFIDYDRNTEEAIWMTERLRSEYPDVHSFAVSAYSEPEAIIAAMRAGCGEYLLKPMQHERVLDGLARVDAKQKKKARTGTRGKVITLVGAKGGTGVTSLALHLALELAHEGKRKCVLVDQHPALGDASLYLGTGRHQYSFYELASNAERLDEELLRGFLLRHNSGLHLLDSPEAVDEIHGASPSAVEHTLAFLADTYQFVIVDCPPGLTEGTRACISQSEQVAIVLTAELPSVRNAVRYIEHLSRLGYSSSGIHVVLNRHSKKGPLSDERIEKALGRAISLRVPNSYNEVIRAINTGAPIPSGGKSDFGAAIQKWAHELASGGGNNKVKATVAAQPGSMRALLGT